MEEYGEARGARNDVTIWRIRVACWIVKATDPHLEYVILSSFLRQQRLGERASVLCYA